MTETVGEWFTSDATERKEVPETRISLDKGRVDFDGPLRVFDGRGVVSFAGVRGGTVREIDGIGGVERDCLGIRRDCQIMLFGGHLCVSGLLELLCRLLVLYGRRLWRCRCRWGGRGRRRRRPNFISRLEEDLEYGL